MPPNSIQRRGRAGWPIVIFDLDGTLVDSAPGTLECLGHMYRELGRPVPPRDELYRHIGPPLVRGLQEIAGMSPHEAATAGAVFRRIYAVHGWSNASAFPGVEGLIASLAAARLTLAVATSKPVVFAEQILRMLGLRRHFAVVAGATMDDARSEKVDVLNDALSTVSRSGVAFGDDVPLLSQAVLVGDRHHDVDAAREIGIASIAVRWGYGTEVEHVRATHTVRDTAELSSLLLP